MGCHPSKSQFQQDAHSDLFRPPAPIPVEIGSAIQHQLRKSSNSIVFIFGGPASQKGIIIQELTSTFNFMLITVEDIVFQYLPNRVNSIGLEIREIQEALKKDEGILTIDWILEMISGRMAGATLNERFVIDIVPAVSSILRADGYKARSHDRQLNEFEMRHPIAFAIDVNVKDEQSVLRGNEVNGRDEDSRKVNPELSNMLRTPDDIDRGKLEKRIAEYHTCAEPFLQYFRKSHRVARMTLTSEAFPNVVNTTRETMLKLGFTMSRRNDNIICFTTDTNHEGIDLTYYKLKLVNAGELSKASDNLSAQIAAVYRYVSTHSAHDDNFLVIVPQNIKNVQNTGKEKRTGFMEKRKDVYLDEFIKNKQHDKPPKFRPRIAVNFISSPRQSFIFFEPFPSNFAQSIAGIYQKLKDKEHSKDS
ncbi:unnamed protein product [Caenorhabditis sp. 36 PRJEB53466]|nr:unnamed protein product [Caenorhabditis sp. 36 PRJEB53466]